jgi:hypothetical protein
MISGVKLTTAELAFLSKIGQRGAKALREKYEDSCVKKKKQHEFENGTCLVCGASERKARASAKNALKGGRPRDKKPSAAAIAKRRSRARLAKAKDV